MIPHHLHFLFVQGGRLVENVGRNSDLAYVVQESPPVYNLEFVVGQPHPPGYLQTRVGDPFRVTSRPRRLGVDCAGQSRERSHIECVKLVNESCIGQGDGHLVCHLARLQKVFLAECRP